MRNVKNTLFFLAFFALISSFYFSRVCIAISRNEAQQALSDAENEMVSAYLAVVEAEKAGANVSQLVSKLQVAASLLAKANNAFRFGDYPQAYDFAVSCVRILEGVGGEAEVLREMAQRNWSKSLFLSAACSGLGLSFLFVLSLFGWRYLKRFYIRRVLEMKPEVKSENEPG